MQTDNCPVLQSIYGIDEELRIIKQFHIKRHKQSKFIDLLFILSSSFFLSILCNETMLYSGGEHIRGY